MTSNHFGNFYLTTWARSSFLSRSTAGHICEKFCRNLLNRTLNSFFFRNSPPNCPQQSRHQKQKQSLNSSELQKLDLSRGEKIKMSVRDIGTTQITKCFSLYHSYRGWIFNSLRTQLRHWEFASETTLILTYYTGRIARMGPTYVEPYERPYYKTSCSGEFVVTRSV